MNKAARVFLAMAVVGCLVAQSRAAHPLPRFDGQQRESEVRVLPHTLRPGDVMRDAIGDGTVLHAPAVYRQGKRVSVRLRLPSGEERVGTSRPTRR